MEETMSQNNSHNTKRYAVVPLALFLLGFSTLSQSQLFFPDRREALIERGRLIFFNGMLRVDVTGCLLDVFQCQNCHLGSFLGPSFLFIWRVRDQL